MTNGEKKGLPGWAKLVIGLVIAGMVMLAALVIGGVIMFGNMQEKSKNPAYAAEVAKTIIKLPEPLPPDFSYSMAMDLLGYKTVVVLHKPDNTEITFISFPQASDTKSQEELLTELADKGIPSQGSQGKFETKSKGTETVGGVTMPYVVGQTTDRSGKTIPAMIGVISSKENNRTIMIYGATPAESYNMDATKTLLSSITGL